MCYFICINHYDVICNYYCNVLHSSEFQALAYRPPEDGGVLLKHVAANKRLILTLLPYILMILYVSSNLYPSHLLYTMLY